MMETIFDELVEWWKNTPFWNRQPMPQQKYLELAFKVLGVLAKDESLHSYNTETEWHQESEEVYLSSCIIEVTGSEKNRTFHIAAYAVVTPPFLAINDRIEEWRESLSILTRLGVLTPNWFLVWHGTIYSYYPPFSLVQYLKDFILDDIESGDLALGLLNNLRGLATYSNTLLASKHYFRTDGLKVYYCGFGFDLGGRTDVNIERNLLNLENEIMPFLPKSFQEKYYSLK